MADKINPLAADAKARMRAEPPATTATHRDTEQRRRVAARLVGKAITPSFHRPDGRSHPRSIPGIGADRP
jgi:hypothetical protein